VISPFCRPTTGPTSIRPGEGPYLFDDKGERYLDFGSGIAVSALGHAHPHLVAALQEQAAKLWHTSNSIGFRGRKNSPAGWSMRASPTPLFRQFGAEAVECAIKMARRYTMSAARRSAIA